MNNDRKKLLDVLGEQELKDFEAFLDNMFAKKKQPSPPPEPEQVPVYFSFILRRGDDVVNKSIILNDGDYLFTINEEGVAIQRQN